MILTPLKILFIRNKIFELISLFNFGWPKLHCAVRYWERVSIRGKLKNSQRRSQKQHCKSSEIRTSGSVQARAEGPSLINMYAFRDEERKKERAWKASRVTGDFTLSPRKDSVKRQCRRPIGRVTCTDTLGIRWGMLFGRTESLPHASAKATMTMTKSCGSDE